MHDFSDIGAARRFQQMHKGVLRYDAGGSYWMRCRSDIWGPALPGDAMRAAIATADAILAEADELRLAGMGGSEDEGEKIEKEINRAVAKDMKAWALKLRAIGKLRSMLKLAEALMTLR